MSRAQHHPVPEKQSHRGLSLLWRTGKSSDQVICILPVSLHSAQLCPRKAATQCAHGGVSLSWLTVKSCYKVICPLGTPLSVLLRAAQWLPAGPLSLERKNTLFQMYFGKTSELSQCDPGDLLTAADCVIPIYYILSCSIPLPECSAERVPSPLWSHGFPLPQFIWL